jgi:hypothetical protein
MSLTLHFNKAVSGSFTGSLLGTASWSQNTISSSHALNADTAITASYAMFAQAVLGGIQNAETASYVLGQNVVGYVASASNANTVGGLSASVFATTGSNIFTGNQIITGTLAVSGNINATGYNVTASAFKGDGSQITGVISSSYALSSSYAANATSASYATTASFASSVLGSSVVGAVPTASYAQKASVAPISVTLNNTFGADVYITQLPAAVTEWDDGQRTRIDLTGYTQARVIARVTMGAGISASVGAMWSTDESTWHFFSGTFGPSASVVMPGTISSTWVPITSSLNQEVVVRWITQNGDNAVNVKLGAITLQAK